MSEVLQYLRTSGPAPALAIRVALRLSHEDVYTHLVAAEARGLVRVNVEFEPRESKLWEAM